MSSSTAYCRFCAEQKPSYNIINLANDAELLNIVKLKLSVFNDGFIDFDNKFLPDTVCSCCFNALDSVYDFCLKLKRSQETLNELCVGQNLFSTKVELEVKTEISLEECDVSDEAPDVITWSSFTYSCSSCTTTTSSLSEFRDHCKNYHGTCAAFKCTDCDEKIDGFEEFVCHVREHWGELRKYCEYCNIKMENKAHKLTHEEDETCTFCGETFEDESSLLTHLKLYRSQPSGLLAFDTGICEGTIRISGNSEVLYWNDYPCICKFCKIRVIDKDMLVDHCMRVHGTCFGMQCVDCDDTPDTFMEFVEHVIEHRSTLRNICPYCDRKMGDYHDTVHIATHTTDKFPCVLCGEIFRQKRKLRRHEMKVNPCPLIKPPLKRRKGPITDKDLTCQICGTLMKTLISLKNHKLLHTDRKRDYNCDRCGKTFYTKSALVSHHKIHENLPPETCKICNKSFLTVQRLRKHLQTHNLVQPFQCDNCKRFFSYKERLREHVKTHMDITPYQCHYCPKKFKHKSIMKVHENQHTGARPYSCEICLMDFTNWSNCNKHMKRKHGTTIAKTVMTPHGKLPINPNTGKPEQLLMDSEVKEWSENMLLGIRKAKK